MNAKKIPVLVVLLIAALGAVVFSWRQSHPSSPDSAISSESASNEGVMIERTDELLSSVQTQIEARTKQLKAVDWPEKVVIPEAAPEVVEEIAEVPAQKELPRLSGVARSGGQTVAFLNGRIAAVGESIEGYEVVEIGDESVVLRDADGGKTTLRLYDSQ